MRLYECGVRYQKMQTNGDIKRVTELFLVDAMSFTEAEARIIEELSTYVSSDLDVVTIKRTNYSELVADHDGAEKWFRAKVNFLTIDEKTAKLKKTAIYYIINADSIDAAHAKLLEELKDTIGEYQIVTLDETRILEVYSISKNEKTTE